ncbi:MAG: HK97 family phage prohead protease [Dehalococcoidales bacterium]
MNQKTFKFEIKSFDDESGEFEGIASAYRKKKDRVGDIVDPGSFTKTINDNSGEFIATYPPHDTDSPVGMIKAVDSKDGLFIKGKLVRGVQKAEEAYLLMKAGVIRTLSIGYETVKAEMIDGVRHLKEIKLYEVGLVPGNLAADDMAKILSVKTALEDEAIKDSEDITVNRVAVKKAITALEALIQDAEIVDLTEDSDALLETEPSTDTQDEEAALNRTLSKLQGANIEKINARIDQILNKIRS